MALQKQTVSLPFTQGLDTKTDDKLSVKLSRLENMVFRGGTLDKRYGTSTLSSAIDTGGSFSAGEQLFPYDSELVRINGGVTYGLGSSSNTWKTKPGGGNYSTLANTRIVRNTRTQTACDQATVNGLSVFAWAETAGPQQGIHVAVYDDTSGTFYQTGAVALASTTNGQYPRCVVAGTSVLVLWTDGVANKVLLGVVDTTSPETVPAVTTLRTDFKQAVANASGLASMDAIEYQGGAACAYLKTGDATNGTFVLMQVLSSGAVSSSPAPVTYSGMQGPSSGLGLNGLGNFGLVVDGSNNLFVIWGEDGAGHGAQAWYMVLNSSFVTVGARSELVVGALFGAAGVAYVSGAATVMAFLSGAGLLYVAKLTPAAGPLSVAPIPFAITSSMASRAFKFNGVPCIGVTTQFPAIQPTGWVVDYSGNPISRMLPGSCALETNGRMPNVTAIGSTMRLLFSERGRITYNSTTNSGPVDVTPIGLTRCALTPVSAGALPVNRVGELVYIGGAVPRVYDGQQVFEEGFPLPGTVGILTPSNAVDGNLTSGVTYLYRSLFSWVDARGQLHRGPPSAPVSVAMGMTDNAVFVPVSPLPLSSKDLLPQGATVQIEVYRSTGNGTLLYKASSSSAPLYNTDSGVTIALIDKLSDAALQSNELLYTTGGILDWLPPPAYKCATVFKSRLVVGGLEDPFECRFSSQAVAGEAVRFNELFSIRVPSDTGPVAALATLDDKLIIFTTQAAYAVVGDGPDNLGNNPFPQPQQILPVDAGPTLAQSVATIPDGVVYQAPRGIMLLDRSLNVQYLGSDVETYTSTNTVRSALLRPEIQQLWLLCDSGNDAVNAYCLVWDYFYKQWSILTVGAGGGQAACYYQGKYTRVRSNGSVLQEQPGTYLDTGNMYSGLVQTNWIKLAGLQGFQRLWRATLLGKYTTDFTLQWMASFDYDGIGPADTIFFNTSGVFGPGIVPFQLRRHMSQQKCESVRFSFSDSLIAGDGHGMALTGLELEYGVKRGAYKLPAAQST